MVLFPTVCTHTPRLWPLAGLRVNQASSSSLGTDRCSEVLCTTVCPSIIGLVAKSLSVIEVLVPPFYFSMLFTFLPVSLWVLFLPQLCFPGFCRDILLGSLKLLLLLNLTLCSLLKCADFGVSLVDGSSERGEKDASKITTYPPGAVRFDCELRAVQVSCGFHHSGRLFSLMAASGQSPGQSCFRKLLLLLLQHYSYYFALQWCWWRMEMSTRLVMVNTGSSDTEMSTPGTLVD